MQTQTKAYKQPVIMQILPELRSGGVERGTIEIARAIVHAGGVAIVVSQGGPMAPALFHCGAKHITMPVASKNPFRMAWNAWKLTRLIRQYQVDIIHARSRAPAWSAWWAAQHTGCRFVTTFHGTYGLQNKWKKKYNAIMTRGERVIAISHFIAEHIKANYEIDAGKLRIIHRGVDVKLFNPGNHSRERMVGLIREWRLPDAANIILFPGRITRWKGQDIFIRALAALPHRNFFAIMLGDDKGHETYRIELEKLIAELGLEGYVRIAKHTHYIAEAYMLSKLVVATSLDPEAFGRVVLEAQAMGKPVIATNHGGPMETVIADTTGWLVTPGDVDQLSRCMAHALALPAESAEWMAGQAIANAQQFSLDKMCTKTIEVYKELLP
jgi:glycosyltransferase involved in cell wall biosynthesis